MSDLNPSLYEMILQNFQGDLELYQVSEQDQQTLSILDNLHRILNSRAGTLAHLPDYGLPDMGLILQGLSGAAHSVKSAIVATLLKYEPRLLTIDVELLPESRPGHLEYTLEAQLKGGDRVTFGTTLIPGGKVVVRHLKRQGYLSKS
ncbi:type VI secretion system baseplate subunit TssE [Pseudomonas huaxiensis]|uniref:type VI secretion system baseplate subunit TssE n=1 Tax=Pseudomonas huaxiensis TaxID=2213017 RepID=UPI000DA6C4B3|nr:type VI secretion system baseplate subunit TssE [Pseudomonas huaxiensis]